MRQAAVRSGSARTWRIDPRTAKVADEIDVDLPEGAYAFAAGGDAVWVSSWSDGTIRRIDPEQRLRPQSIPVR